MIKVNCLHLANYPLLAQQQYLSVGAQPTLLEKYSTLTNKRIISSDIKQTISFQFLLKRNETDFSCLVKIQTFFPLYSSSYAVNSLFSSSVEKLKNLIFQENKLSHTPSLQNNWQKFLDLLMFLSAQLLNVFLFVCFCLFGWLLLFSKGVQRRATLGCSSLYLCILGFQTHQYSKSKSLQLLSK